MKAFETAPHPNCVVSMRLNLSNKIDLMSYVKAHAAIHGHRDFFRISYGDYPDFILIHADARGAPRASIHRIRLRKVRQHVRDLYEVTLR